MKRITAVIALAFGAIADAAAPTSLELPYACNDKAKELVAKALYAIDNVRVDEARPLFVRAIAADDQCLMARLVRAQNTPGPESKKALDDLIAQGESAPEIEKKLLALAAAERDGLPIKVLEIAEQLRTAHPAVYRAQMLVTRAAWTLEKWAVVTDAAGKATKLAPESGAAWNAAGYAALATHQNAGAVAAFTKYTEVAPTEPNAHDSLGDALLAEGKLTDAAAAYQKALDVSNGKFWGAHDGLAAVKAMQGDYPGAHAAIVLQQEVAPLAPMKQLARRWTAWLHLAQGNLPDAVKTMDAAAAEASAAKIYAAIGYSSLLKSIFFAESGKWSESIDAAAGLDTLGTEGLTAGEAFEFKSLQLAGAVRAQAHLGKMADAAKSLADLKKHLHGHKDPGSRDNLAFAEGQLALAKKDHKGAVAAFKRCGELNHLCRMHLARAVQKTDPAAAKKLREALITANHRDPVWNYSRAKLMPKAAAGKKIAADAVK